MERAYYFCLFMCIFLTLPTFPGKRSKSAERNMQAVQDQPAQLKECVNRHAIVELNYNQLLDSKNKKFSITVGLGAFVGIVAWFRMPHASRKSSFAKDIMSAAFLGVMAFHCVRRWSSSLIKRVLPSMRSAYLGLQRSESSAIDAIRRGINEGRLDRQFVGQAERWITEDYLRASERLGLSSPEHGDIVKRMLNRALIGLDQ